MSIEFNRAVPSTRNLWLRRFAVLAISLLMLRVLATILWEYRLYFPANFESSFLGARRYTFTGFYPIAFYVHIISSPVAWLLGSFLFVTGGRASFAKAHRRTGRVLVAIVMLAVLPSGLAMAASAQAGPIAGVGFACLSIATAVCVSMTAWQARKRRFKFHQQWATRTYLLLCSPLLLRAISGATIAAQMDSPWTYRANAWLSWLVPLLVYEIQKLMRSNRE